MRNHFKALRQAGGTFLLAVIPLLPGPGNAAPALCGPREALLDELAGQYSEAPAAVGLTSEGALLEVLTSGDGSTWTIIVSEPKGTSCIVAAGESWQETKRIVHGGLGT